MSGNNPKRPNTPMRMMRFAVSPETVTVLGYKVKDTDLMWLGLDFSGAEPRQQASIFLAMVGANDAPPDVHLSVPWWHPNDGPPPVPPEMYYRVRPRMKPGKIWNGKRVRSVAFERWNGQWFLAVLLECEQAKGSHTDDTTSEATAGSEAP